MRCRIPLSVTPSRGRVRPARAVVVTRRREDAVASDGKAQVTPAAGGALVGPIWFIGWLFTIAFAKLVWWEIILGIVIWPYYLGVAAR